MSDIVDNMTDEPIKEKKQEKIDTSIKHYWGNIININSIIIIGFDISTGLNSCWLVIDIWTLHCLLQEQKCFGNIKSKWYNIHKNNVLVLIIEGNSGKKLIES